MEAGVDDRHPEQGTGQSDPVFIDQDRCQGHAVCSLYAPQMFDHDSQGHAVVVGDVLADDLPAAELAAEGCPEGAIHVRREAGA